MSLSSIDCHGGSRPTPQCQEEYRFRRSAKSVWCLFLHGQSGYHRFFPTQRCFRHCPIHRLSLPNDSLFLIVLNQSDFPQLLKQSRPGPFLKPQVSGRTGTDARRVKGFPLAAGASDEQDGIKHLSVVSTLPSAASRRLFTCLGINGSIRAQSSPVT